MSPGAAQGKNFLPTWDRFAHVAIAFTRQVVTTVVPPDQAFRHIVLMWKALLVTKLTVVRSTLLPQLAAGELAMPNPEVEKEKSKDK